MKFWKALSFKAKTVIALGSVLLLVSLTIIYSVYATSKMTSRYQQILDQELVVREYLRELEIELLTARRNEKDFILRKDEKYITANAETLQRMRDLVKKIEDLKGYDFKPEDDEAIKKSIEVYEKGFAGAVSAIKAEGSGDKGLVGELRSLAHEMEKIIKDENLPSTLLTELLMLRRHEKDFLLRRDVKYISSAKEVVQKFENATDNEQISKKLHDLAIQYGEKLEEVSANYNKQVDSIASFRDSIHKYEKIIHDNLEIVHLIIDDEILILTNMSKTNLLISVVAGSTSLAIFLFIVAFYFNSAKTIALLATHLKETSEATSGSSDELKKTAEELSASVQEQSSAIIETVSTLDEIREMMKRSVDNAVYSEEKSTESHSVANEGKKAVAEVVKAINEISDCNNDITGQMEKTSNELEQIVRVIKEISDKTKVINDIVFQTKLLSFNASVEAARAGDHGKGFAVVAEEVGNLAQMSGNASKEIETLISSSVNRVESIVRDSKESVSKLVATAKSKTDYGVVTAQKCNKVLDEVVDNVAKVKDLMKEISGAASEQAIGVENISTAMNELDQVTHTNTTIATQTSGSSTTLAHQANNLNEIVLELEGIMNGVKDANQIVKNKVSNVVKFEPKFKNEVASRQTVKEEPVVEIKPIPAVKKVSGENYNMTPSKDDERFEDI